MKTIKSTLITAALVIVHLFAFAQKGKNGNATVTSANTVVNTYTYLTSNATTGSFSINVANNAMNGGLFTTSLQPGDLILIIQMQGASIDINTTPTTSWGGNYTVPSDYLTGTWGANPQYFGRVTNFNNAGRYEKREVLSVSGTGVINLTCELKNNYTASGHVQVVRIPRFDNLTVNSGASIVPTLWDGQTGGVVAVEVETNLNLQASSFITAAAAGFRGGALDPASSTGGDPSPTMRFLGSYDNLQGSEKGEGIGGFYTEYDALFSRYGLGAAANGGGGGGFQNTGGGGGSNVDLGFFGLPGSYTGKGTPIGYVSTWNLELTPIGGTSSAGGGRGGYALSQNDLNENVVGPDNNSWGGDGRKTNGGFGGHPLPFDNNLIFFGGGGGAGDQDSGEGGAGGRGGGIVFVTCYGTITGSGTISAAGGDGQNSNPANAAPTTGTPRRGNDGAGGGGAGGSIHIENDATVPATILLDVHGGDGGDHNITLLNVSPLPPLSSEGAGPGGSGSGGLIVYANGAAPTKNLAAGTPGATNSSHLTNFPPNGATSGKDGVDLTPTVSYHNITALDQSICSGATATLTATIIGTQPTGSTIAWFDAYSGGTQVGTGTTFTTPALTATTTYYVGLCPGGTFRVPVTVTILPPDDASFSYSSTNYCVNDVDPTPTITGLAGGTFSSTAGLSINASTGTIDVSASTPGTYTVTYLTNGPCPASSNVSVTIDPLDDATFSYSAATYCINDVDPTPTATLPGGTYSAAPVGLSINASTGTIDLSASTPGTYDITYTTAGACPNSSIQSVTVTNLDDASFSYSSASYCTSEPDPTPTATTAGGTYSSSPIGLSINSTTGVIDLSASTVGSYTVTYTTAGSCSNSSNQTVTVTALDDATFSYAMVSYCVNDADPTPTAVTSGGSYSSTAGLVINATTGAIDVSASTPGTYTITYATTGACANSSTTSVTINALDDASFSYSAGAYCVNDVDPTPTITGLTGGTFSSTAGLSINASTGTIDVSTSTPGAYTVTYTTTGTCPNSSNVSVTINALDDASFSYSSASYCASDVDPTPTITGLAGGTFSSTAGLSINASTGAIDVSASTPGAYTVTYTTSGTCPNSSNVSVTINALDDASFSYSAAAYCINDVDPTPTITGIAGGTFSSTAGLSINASTGTIDVSASTPGSYTVTYTTSGTCPNSSSVSIIINALDDATFNYSAASYCVNATDPTPTVTGVAGGTFSSTAGLVINASTGAIDLSASTIGIYTVTYTTSGTCPNSSIVSVEVTALDDASFAYGAASYCVGGVDPTPTPVVAGGTYSSTVGLSINTSTGTIDLSASTPGTYTVDYTTSGVCSNTSSQSVTITSLDDASFSYPLSAYCVSDTDPTPTAAVAGGTYSSAAGLSINASTGVIDVSASTAGTYTVTYTTSGSCSNSSNVSVTINALDDATFSYSAGAYCLNDLDPTPTITGLAGGSFSSTAGLSINASTGTIDVSASTPGSYTITYTTAGTCPNSSNVSVIINALDDASFSYSAAAYCVNDVDPTPTITGLAGGTFSSTAGLSINASTGAIDVSASTAGSYTVTYTTAGTCPNSSNVSVTINALDDASFSYSAAAYCVNDVDPTPTISGLTGGTFSSTAGLSINATTGVIDVSASTPGTYTVTYTTAGICPNSSNVSVTINPLDDASFSYSLAAYCVNDVDPTPTITGVAGGNFSSSVGLLISATTGVIDVSASTPGTYTVTYTTAGTCPNSSNVSVTINPLDDATFSYGAATYCISDADPTPTISGLSGGTFSSTAGLSINASTGAIDVSASTPGTYNVTYTTAGTCPNSSIVSVTITALDDASFGYLASAYCVNDVDPSPTATTSGGTYSSTAGLSINASTGVIDVSASTPGTYTVTYATSGACSNSSNVSVTINALDDASFSYSAATYCVNDVDPTPTITGLAGGTFSSTSGLSINASTGVIDVSASTPGSYSITYTTAGACPNTSSVTVAINALDDATFVMAPTCDGGTASVSGTTGGVFTFTVAPSDAAVIDGVSGTVSNGTSGATYDVTYTTSGACPVSSTQTVTALTADDPSFTMTATCDGGTATISGTTGGTFTFMTIPTDGATIDPSTGTVSNGSSGSTYTVTYTTNGACPMSMSQTVTTLLTPVLDPIADQSACDQFILPTITGVNLSGNEAYYNNSQASGGTVITGPLTNSQTVYVYDVNAGCSDEISFVVTINSTDDPSFTLTDHCQGSSNSATISGTTGGTFEIVPPATDGATIDGATGEIINGVGGTFYTVLYTTNGVCPASATQTVQVFTIPSAPLVSSDETYCVGDSLNPMTATGINLTWYDDISLTNVVSTSASYTSVITSEGTQYYYVTQTENGCEGPEATIAVIIEACDIIVPTAITPNGDGAHDNWEIPNIDIVFPNNIVRVYNRWGNLVFESTQGDYDNNRWDGTYNGEMLPVGSYYFIIEPNDGKSDAKTGTVSIILD